MEQGTYSKESVVNLVNAYFTPIMVNGWSDEKYTVGGKTITARQLASQFGLRGFPTTCFLLADGSPLNCQPGFIKAEQFENVLKYIGQEHYKDKSYQEYLKSVGKKS